MSSSLHIYNSLTRSKEEFKPLHTGFAGMYVCGPTVYNYMHLGNLRTFITFDVVFRYLTALGYKVRYVRNITDVGHITTNDSDEGTDRIGNQARLEQLEPMEIVQKYTVNFHEILHLFNCLPPSVEPTATGHIIEQIELIKNILSKGYAYEVNGSVYFDVQSYRKKYNYGELSGRQVEELMENTRQLEAQDEKRFFADFALWKNASPSHIMRWPSPWGQGFPGWHLECSAMSNKYLGSPFDIHGGGMDLKFPHHESEVAQHKACTGQAPARYWMHGNMLTVNGQKMSKSLGNSFLPIELVTGSHPVLEKGYSPMTIRFFFLQAHYASTLDFTNEAMQAAEKGFKRLMAATDLLDKLQPSDHNSWDVHQLKELCENAMNDDFNCPVLLARLFDAVVHINRMSEGMDALLPNALTELKAVFHTYLHDILGLTRENEIQQGTSLESVMEVVLELRQAARLRKDFSTSDLIRDRLKSAGIEIKDGKDGVTWEIL